ncbi:sigma-70 family RNA polymerase sigma factor [Amycolatopsis magusensis]|uniref:sigma-70 family RNA polymerase sigma factor n=1 Tax=Amycolatopsis magusensis TaxID=882444 RepID=UPI0035591800
MVRPTDDTEITRWARLAARGDQPAFERFLRATQPQVRRFVAGLTDQQSADDLTQETYLRALRGLSRFRGESSARTWLLSIARRVAADHLRSAASRPRLAVLADWQAAAEGAGHTTPVFEDRVALHQLIAGLRPERRDAFVLTQSLGLSYVDAAAVCGCPVGTIRSRLARAREDLVTAMAESPPRRRTA